MLFDQYNKHYCTSGFLKGLQAGKLFMDTRIAQTQIHHNESCNLQRCGLIIKNKRNSKFMLH